MLPGAVYPPASASGRRPTACSGAWQRNGTWKRTALSKHALGRRPGYAGRSGRAHHRPRTAASLTRQPHPAGQEPRTGPYLFQGSESFWQVPVNDSRGGIFRGVQEGRDGLTAHFRAPIIGATSARRLADPLFHESQAFVGDRFESIQASGSGVRLRQLVSALDPGGTHAAPPSPATPNALSRGPGWPRHGRGLRADRGSRAVRRRVRSRVRGDGESPNRRAQGGR